MRAGAEAKDVVDLADALARGELTSTELMDRALARFAETEPRIHAFAWLDPDRARRLAKERDSQPPTGMLHGVPIGVKDVFDTAGIPTEHGSALFKGRVPSRDSDVVRARIKRYYGRDSEVIHPPVDVDTFTPAAERGDFWVIVSRLSAYKRVDVAVKAFNEVGMRLIVVGDGRERRPLERLARDNVTFAGRVDDETVKQLLGSARGFIFPAEDDFGIVCVEALASGAPVVALGRGGATEIIRDGVDGALVADPDPQLFVDAVRRIEQAGLDPQELRRSARRFDVSRFESRIRASIDHARAEGRSS